MVGRSWAGASTPVKVPAGVHSTPQGPPEVGTLDCSVTWLSQLTRNHDAPSRQDARDRPAVQSQEIEANVSRVANASGWMPAADRPTRRVGIPAGRPQPGRPRIAAQGEPNRIGTGSQRLVHNMVGPGWGVQPPSQRAAPRVCPFFAENTQEAMNPAPILRSGTNRLGEGTVIRRLARESRLPRTHRPPLSPGERKQAERSAREWPGQDAGRRVPAGPMAPGRPVRRGEADPII